MKRCFCAVAVWVLLLLPRVAAGAEVSPDPDGKAIKATIDLVNSEAADAYTQAWATWKTIGEMQAALLKKPVQSSYQPAQHDLKIGIDLDPGGPIWQLSSMERSTLAWSPPTPNGQNIFGDTRPFALGDRGSMTHDTMGVDIHQRTSAYLGLYRAYLVNGDADALLEAALKLTPDPALDHDIEAAYTFRAGEGDTFFRSLTAQNAGWFLYHRRHLDYQLAFLTAHGHVHHATGETLGEGIVRWTALQKEFRPAYAELMKSDIAVAQAQAAEIGVAQSYAAGLDDIGRRKDFADTKPAEMDELFKAAQVQLQPLTQKREAAEEAASAVYRKVLRIASHRIEGIEFRTESREPGTFGVFGVDPAISGGTARTSSHAALFRALAPLVAEPGHTHTLFLAGPGIPARGDFVRIASDNPAITYSVRGFKGDATDPAWADAWSRGWALATEGMERAEAQRFHDEVGAMLVDAHLDGALGGLVQPAVVSKSGLATGTWILAKGDVKAALGFVRRRTPLRLATASAPAAVAAVAGAEFFDRTDFLFLPEKTYLQIETDRATDLEQIPVVIGVHGTFATEAGSPILHALRVAPGKNIFRTGPILVHASGDKVLAGEAGVLDLTVQPNEVLLAKIADDSLLAAYPGVCGAALLRAPPTPWSEALYRAGSDDRVANWHSFSSLLTGTRPATADEIGEISHTPLKGDSATATKIRLGHLAAMIELRNTFILMMKDYQKQLATINTPELAAGLLHDLAPHLGDPAMPFASVEIEAPRTTMMARKMPLAKLLDRDYLLGTVGVTDTWLSSPAYRLWVQTSFQAALAQYKKAVADALAAAQATTDDDYAGLLQLTGRGFEPVVQRVMMQMVRLQEDGNYHMQWVTDPAARDYVNSIAALADEARAGKEYNKQLLSTVAMALSLPALFGEGPAAVALSLIANAGMGVDAAADLLEKGENALRGRDELQFALGSGEVIEAQRLDLARLEDKPVWQSATVLAMSGVGVAGDCWRAAAGFTTAQAAARARLLLTSDQPATDTLRLMRAEDQAATLRAIESVQRSRNPAAALSADQQKLLAFGEKLDADARLAGRNARAALRLESTDPFYGLPPLFEVKTLPKMPGDALSPFSWLPKPGDQVPYTTPAGTSATFYLGKILGIGNYAQVYELHDAAGNTVPFVIKFIRKSRAEAADVVKAIEHGATLLHSGPGEDILQLPILYASHDAPHPFLIQERLTGEMETFGLVFHNAQEVITGESGLSVRRSVLVFDGLSGGEFTRAHQRAVCRLYRKLADKGLFWEDGHIENVFFVKKPDGTIDAGVLDQDRIISLDENCLQVDSAQAGRQLFLMRSAPNAETTMIPSLENCTFGQTVGEAVPAQWSGEMVNCKMLEYGKPSRAYIRYDREAKKFVSNIIDLDIVREFFPKVDEWVDYDFTKGADPPLKPHLAPSRPVGSNTGTGGIGPPSNGGVVIPR